MLDLVSVVVLAGHLLLANLASAGPLAGIWLDHAGRRGDDPLAAALNGQLARLSLWSLVVAALLGAALFGLLWLGEVAAYWTAFAAIRPSRWWFALAEWAFSLVLLAWYARLTRVPGRFRPLRHLLALLSATNLLYHFPPLFTVVATVAGREMLAAGAIDSSAYRAWVADPEVLSKVVHVWLASLAVSGVALAVLAERAIRLSGQPQSGERWTARGAWLALAASVAQLPAGLWLVAALPRGNRDALLGADALATGMLLLAIVTALWLLHALAAVALGDRRTKAVRRALHLLCGVVLLMCAVLLHGQRRAMRPWEAGSPGSSPVAASIAGES